METRRRIKKYINKNHTRKIIKGGGVASIKREIDNRIKDICKKKDKDSIIESLRDIINQFNTTTKVQDEVNLRHAPMSVGDNSEDNLRIDKLRVNNIKKLKKIMYKGFRSVSNEEKKNVIKESFLDLLKHEIYEEQFLRPNSYFWDNDTALLNHQLEWNNSKKPNPEESHAVILTKEELNPKYVKIFNKKYIKNVEVTHSMPIRDNNSPDKNPSFNVDRVILDLTHENEQDNHRKISSIIEYIFNYKEEEEIKKMSNSKSKSNSKSNSKSKSNSSNYEENELMDFVNRKDNDIKLAKKHKKLLKNDLQQKFNDAKKDNFICRIFRILYYLVVLNLNNGSIPLIDKNILFSFHNEYLKYTGEDTPGFSPDEEDENSKLSNDSGYVSIDTNSKNNSNSKYSGSYGFYGFNNNSGSGSFGFGSKSVGEKTKKKR